MEWEVPEHVHHEKSNDWYAAVIVIAGVLVAAMFYYGSFVMLTLTVVATTAILIVASRPPRIIAVNLLNTGVRAGSVFYPYSTLDAFNVIDHDLEHKILLESVKTYLPLIVVPVPDEVSREEVHDFLAQYLPNKDLREPMAHRLADYLGF